MKKVVAAAFLSLDGVMQAPGDPQEDPTGSFRFGGWLPPHWDDVVAAGINQTFSAPFDLLQEDLRHFRGALAVHHARSFCEYLRCGQRGHVAPVRPHQQIRGDTSP